MSDWSQPPLFSLEEGEARKRAGQVLVETFSVPWIHLMRFEAWRLAANGRHICSDDLRLFDIQLRDGGCQPSHPNAWGTIFKGKEWEFVGYRKSRWPSNHARRISVWKWRDTF